MEIETIKKKIGAGIKKFRTDNKLTQEQFAELIEIEQPALSNIENGKAYPSFFTVCSLIEKGKMAPDKLFGFLYKKKTAIEDEIAELLKPLPLKTKECIKEIAETIRK